MEYFACRLSDLKEGKSHVFVINEVEVAIVRNENQIYAYENRCRHAGGPVGLGDLFGKVKVELNNNKEVVREYVDTDEMCLVCPWHGYEYDVKTGECASQKSLKIKKLKTVIKDDHVYIAW